MDYKAIEGEALRPEGRWVRLWLNSLPQAFSLSIRFRGIKAVKAASKKGLNNAHLRKIYKKMQFFQKKLLKKMLHKSCKKVVTNS